MGNFDFINDIYVILTSNITVTEIMLNLTFILILLIISYIFYWDILNKQIIKNSKCKNNLDFINGEKKYYYVTAKDENNVPLYSVKYNMVTKKASIDCKCPTGEQTNSFNKIKVYDKSATEGQKSLVKSIECKCDKSYPIKDVTNTDPNIYYSGNQFLINYMEQSNTITGSNNYFTDSNIPNFPANGV